MPRSARAPGAKGKASAHAPAATPARSAQSAQEAMLMAGLTAFHAHHQATYRGRWLRTLYPALLLSHPSVAVINAHLPQRQLEAVRRSFAAQGATRWLRGHEGEAEAWRFEDATLVQMEQQQMEAGVEALSLDGTPAPPLGRFLPPTPLDPTSSLLPYYLLDGASLLAVDALQVEPQHAVLDLCAAPGGKSVCIAQRLDMKANAGAPVSLTPSSAGTLATALAHSLLHANEPQANRRLRLQSVLDEYIPPAVRRNRARVEVTSWDGTRVSLPGGKYDRVLVDAPCSSDRHVLQSPAELAAWSVKRIKTNAERQVSLLLNALRSTKEGGICVYATCSLSRKENDEVVEAVMEKLQKGKLHGASARVKVRVLKMALRGKEAQPQEAAAAAASTEGTADDGLMYMPMGEPTKYGWMVLPDQATPILSAAPVPASATGPSDAAAAAAPVPASTDAAAVEGADSSAAAPAASAAAAPAPAVGHGFGPLYFCRLQRLSGRDAGSDEEDEDSEEESAESEGEIEPRRPPDRQLPMEEYQQQL